MRLNPKAYDAMVREASPRSPLLKDCLWAFCVGGSICLLGEILNTLYCRAGFYFVRCRRTHQCYADCAFGHSHRAGLVSKACFQGRGRYACPHHRLCQFRRVARH